MGSKSQPFAFIIDFDFRKPLIFDHPNSRELLWQTPSAANFDSKQFPDSPVEWHVSPVRYERYQQAFQQVINHLRQGDTYLLNLTMPTEVETNLSLEELFHRSRAPYKIWLKDEFLCFSPEIFVRINDGTISSFPMKGTIDASLENAAELLLNDEKEVAEHHTIVDLIRNDLSMAASEVEVKRLMYLDRITTNKGEILQMSSEISGKLPVNYTENIGTMIAKMLPAGSICGAPKPKTVEIIREAEKYDRGYYTGIFGYFDGKNLDSCVLIRYLEISGNKLTYKSGGGITFMSNCQSEYDELIRKVYVPVG
jgi:para-aminobenzoate synthetase component 1